MTYFTDLITPRGGKWCDDCVTVFKGGTVDGYRIGPLENEDVVPVPDAGYPTIQHLQSLIVPVQGGILCQPVYWRGLDQDGEIG